MKDAAGHYDAITQAWSIIMGAEFHFGIFPKATPDADYLNYNELHKATRALTRLMAEQSHFESSDTLLDIGCGIGGPLSFAVEEFGVRGIGLSNSPLGCAAAVAHSKKLGLDNRCAFICADGTQTGLADQSCDVIWLLECSHLFPDKETLLRETFRLLRPNGRLVICDIVTKNYLNDVHSIANAKKFLTVDAAFGKAYTTTPDTYLQLIEKVGFSRATWLDLSEQVQRTPAIWAHRAESFIASGDLVWDPLLASRFQRACHILSEFYAAQVLGYGLTVTRKPHY